MAYRGYTLLMILAFFVMANATGKWAGTLNPGFLSADEIAQKGFRNGKWRVKCDEHNLSCGGMEFFTSITADLSNSETWLKKWDEAMNSIRGLCFSDISCVAVNIEWFVICSTVGEGLIDCRKANKVYDYIGINIFFQKVINSRLSMHDSTYSITLSEVKTDPEKKWTDVERRLCSDLWKKANLQEGDAHKMQKQYEDKTRWFSLYDFQSTGLNTPPCTPSQDCSKNRPLTLQSKSFLRSSEDCQSGLFDKIAGSGYNVILGSPMAQNDAGYTNNPVFKATGFDSIQSSTNGDDGCPIWKWRFPKGHSITVSNRFSASTSTDDMYSEQTYQETAKNRISVTAKGTYVGVTASFTGSSDFESFSKNVVKTKMVQVRQFREAPAFVSSVHMHDVVFADDYLKSLASAYREKDFSLFLSSYGTHVTTEVTHGARFSQVSTFTTRNFEMLKTNSRTYKLGLEASYGNATGSTEYENHAAKEAREVLESKRESVALIAIGAGESHLDMSTGEGISEYERLAHQFPETLGAKLLPHSTLIKHRWDDIKSAIPDVDRELFFKYYGDYIDVYCGGLKHKCKASDFEDGPGAMSLGWDNAVDSPYFGVTDCEKDRHYPCHKVEFHNKAELEKYQDTLTIRKIQMQCKDIGSNHGARVQAVRFVLDDYSNSLPLLSLGNWDPSLKPTAEDTIGFSEEIASVLARGGADLDYLEFSIKDADDQYRTVGCGGNGGGEMQPISFSGYRLLDYSGYQDNRSGYIRAISFRKFPVIFKSKTATKENQKLIQEDNQLLYQSLIAQGKSMALKNQKQFLQQNVLESSNATSQTTLEMKEHSENVWETVQNLEKKIESFHMWEKFQNFEKKVEAMENAIQLILDEVEKIHGCTSSA